MIPVFPEHFERELAVPHPAVSGAVGTISFRVSLRGYTPLRPPARAARPPGRPPGLSLLWRAGVALLLPLPAHAQVPNAGQAMRDIETARPVLPAAPVPEIKITTPQPDADVTPDSGPRMFVQAFTLEGNQVFHADELLPQLADLAGRELGFADLQQAAARITAYYRERGYVLARAYLPHQEIDGGVVRIAVVEGRYGRIVLNNRSRVSDGALQQPLSALRPGAVVRGADLERTLQLLDDLAGATARGTLRAGIEPGTTDLVVDVEGGPLVTGSLDFDNFGDTSSGRYRFSGSVNLNSPLGLGDQLSLRGLASDERQSYYRAAYQLPLGPVSTRVGVAYSEMRYHLTGSFAELDYRGSASVQSAFVAQPLLRSRNLNVTAQVQYDNKDLKDTYGQFDVRNDKNVGLWSVSVSGNGEDGWFGGGRSALSMTLGLGRLRGNDALGSDRYTKAMGSFTKLNVSALRLQALGRRFQLYTQFSGQLASRNLDGSEKFSLGGPYGVRAYALGAGSGDQGWQASAELRYLPAPRWQLSAFVDAGQVQFNKHPWTRERNTQQLQAAGVGAGWSDGKRQATLTAAWPLSSAAGSPARAPSVWLQATQYF